MDRSDARRIIEANIESLMRACGLPHWKITVSTDLANNPDSSFGRGGRCTFNVDYNRAHIQVNPDEHDDADQLRETLRHELYHCVLAPMDLVIRAARQYAEGDAKTTAILESIDSHACEKTVINLERLWVGARGYHAGRAKAPRRTRKR